jgi:AraC-like DNA-binding protein
MSGRQLQRVLQAEGTTYQALLDEARRDLALARLRLPGTTAAEVALLLGYSEAGAFTRAFRRWTGTTPGAYAAGAAGRGAT